MGGVGRIFSSGWRFIDKMFSGTPPQHRITGATLDPGLKFWCGAPGKKANKAVHDELTGKGACHPFETFKKELGDSKKDQNRVKLANTSVFKKPVMGFSVWIWMLLILAVAGLFYYKEYYL